VRTHAYSASAAQAYAGVAKEDGAGMNDADVNAPFPVCEHHEDALSIAAARQSLARKLRDRGLAAADLDARLLIGHALGLDHTALAAQAQRILTPDETAITVALAARRLAHEPVARILGRKEFWGLSLRLNPETFVPRPETETVVTATLAALDCDRSGTRALRIADLGTGSGALLLAILSEIGADACGIGTDVSLAALDCARTNAAAQCAHASFIACNYAAALNGPVDVVVSNPPYIPRQEIASLEPEVREFDPCLALDGGRDGLNGYRTIAADARRILAPDGVLVVELGFGQAAAVSSIFAAAGLVCSEPQPDLSGIPRALVARPLP
jgi:release factor glutamine methyltransferase